MIKLEVLEFVNNIHSSYKNNNFGMLFYCLVRCLQPEVCVEIGVLDGYSTIFIASALKDNGKGKLFAYDLWEKYPYRHATLEDTQNNIDRLSLNGNVELLTKNGYEVHMDWEDNSVNFVHIDISNDGDIFNTFLKNFHSKLRLGSIIIFEGGSAERDEFYWMVNFNKPKIRKAIKENTLLKRKYEFLTLDPFPSITICKKIKD